jgi:hypothetical protein
MTMQDGIRAVQRAFAGSSPAPRWPMYVRQAKQFLRNAISGFDERNYGFSSVADLLRAAGKEGVLRVDRDRQGAVRVFAGPKLTALALGLPVDEPEMDEVDELAASVAPVVSEAYAVAEPEFVSETPILEAVAVAEIPMATVIVMETSDDLQGAREPAEAEAETAAPSAAPRRGGRRRPARSKSAGASASGRPARSRARKPSRSKAAD